MASKNRRLTLGGKRFLINLNYGGGVRKSPGANERAGKIKACAKNKDLATRKKCFKTGG